MVSSALRTAGVCYVVVLVLLACAQVVDAQGYTTVASTVVVDGVARDGDIISYDPTVNIYHAANVYADEMLFGVVVMDPVLMLYPTEGGDQPNGVPLVRYGEARVNVTTLGGTIRAGDLVTSSPVEGFGQRVSREAGTYVLGFALEDMKESGETAVVGETTVNLGTVSVALRIGPFVAKEGSELIASSSFTSNGGITNTQEKGGFDTFKLFRYIMASLVAALTVLVSARRFGDTFSQSVISVGRNPLARSQIRSIVIWNSFLITMISSVGFGISALILFLP